MVMGFGGGTSTTPTASLNPVKGNANGTTASLYTVSVVSISSNNVLYADAVLTYAPLAAGQPTALTPTLAGATHVTAGDYVTISLLKGTTYTLSLIYKPTGNAIASTVINVPA
jgi:hypothetical protein